MPKVAIRRQVIDRRRGMPEAERAGKSLEIQEAFVRLPEYARAKTVGLYSPISNEVSTEGIFCAARAAGKRVAYPRVRGSHLEMVVVDRLEALVPGSFGVLEPRAGETLDIEDFDLLAVPGVSFDLCGYRLGYGKGFYDRLLHSPIREASLAGLCFELQLVGALPAETHDVRMDLLVTEKRVLRFGNG